MKRIVTFLLTITTVLSLHAQSTLNATGNSKVINGNTHSYSIGEMTLVHTASASNIVVTQGVLQSSEGSVGLDNNELTKNELIIYPNPTKDVIKLQVGSLEEGEMNVILYDALGKQLISKSWNVSSVNLENQISLQDFASGQYILKVIYKSKQNKILNQSYKIQKLN